VVLKSSLLADLFLGKSVSKQVSINLGMHCHYQEIFKITDEWNPTETRLINSHYLGWEPEHQ
jgi:hypothetical protein